MPDYTALAIAFLVLLCDGFHDLLNGKILLVAADLFHIGIKQDEVPDQIKNTFPAEQGNDVFVLLRWHAVRDQPGQLPVHESLILLFPDRPEFLGRAGSGVLHGVLIGCHHDLCKLEQLRNIVLALIADHLLNRLFFAYCRGFTLDNAKGNAINEQHNVGASILLLVPTVA